MLNSDNLGGSDANLRKHGNSGGRAGILALDIALVGSRLARDGPWTSKRLKSPGLGVQPQNLTNTTSGNV